MGTAGSVLNSHYFFMLAGVKMESVPYKGAGPLMIDAMGGHVPLAIGAVSSVQAAVRLGRVRMLGVTSPSSAFPDVPLISKDVAGFDGEVGPVVNQLAVDPEDRSQRGLHLGG